MKQLLPFLLSLKLVLLAQVATLVTIDPSGCLLSIQYVGNSSAFSLTACYYIDDDEKIKATSSWPECTNNCCQTKKEYDQVQHSLDTCGQVQENNNSKEQIWKTIVIVVGIVSPIILLFIGHLLWQYWKEKRNSSVSPGIQENANPNNINHILQSNLIDSYQFNQIGWKSSRSLQGDCPICLEPNCDLHIQNCKHHIHIQCWRQWYKGHKSCVTCRSPSVDKVNVYCSRCLLHCFQCRSEDLMRTSTTHKFICSKCKIEQQNQ